MKSEYEYVVYTAVFGAYDEVPSVNPQWNCDFYCFTDNRNFLSSGWKVILVESLDEGTAQTNRRYKMLPHKFLPNHKASLYVDGNVEIVTDPSPLFKKYLRDAHIAIPKHQDRHCAYEEADLCIHEGRVNEQETIQQMDRYRQEGFPANYGLTENGIIFRRHHESAVVNLMEAWWQEYLSGGKRDQISLPYLLWKNNTFISEVTEGPRISNSFFKIGLHNSAKKKPFFRRAAILINSRKRLSSFYFFLSLLVSFVLAAKKYCWSPIRKV